MKPEPSHKNKPTEEKKSSSSLLSSYVSRKQEKKQQDTRSGTLSNYVSRKPNLQFQVKDLTQNLLQNQHINTNHGNSKLKHQKRVIIAENNDNEDEEDDDDDKPIKASRNKYIRSSEDV